MHVISDSGVEIYEAARRVSEALDRAGTGVFLHRDG